MGLGSIARERTTVVVPRQTTGAFFGHPIDGAALFDMMRKDQRKPFPFAERVKQARLAAGFEKPADLDRELALRKGWIRGRGERAPQRVWAMEERPALKNMKGQKYNEHAPDIAAIIRERLPDFSTEWLITGSGESGLKGKRQKKNSIRLDKDLQELARIWNTLTPEGRKLLLALAKTARDEYRHEDESRSG